MFARIEWGLTAAVLCLTLSCTSAKPGQKFISKADFGDRWPLTIDSGILTCSGQAVTFEARGTVYAVNGMAMTLRRGQDIDPIWAAGEPLWVTDPQSKQKVNAGPRKKEIGPLVEEGLKLCSGR